jgi:hypothetical protein
MSSEYRIEKVPVPATVVLSNGVEMSGHFFQRPGPVPGEPGEDVRAALNTPERFFPFHAKSDGGAPAQVHLLNRRHVVLVRLGDPAGESTLAGSTGITPRKFATLLLSNGESVSGVFRVAMPSGRTRISDYANSEERFCYLEGPEGVFIVNLDETVDILTFSGAAGDEE